MLDPAPAYALSAIAVPPSCEPNFRIKRGCKTFAGAFFCGMEWDEWQLARALVGPQDVVLELGARFGTTSCVLAKQTGNTGRVVSVEPDASVHDKLLRNRAAHNCSFHVLKGVVGDAPLAMSRRFSHYATQTRAAQPHERNTLPSLDVASLERRIGHRFTTLLIVCSPASHLRDRGREDPRGGGGGAG